MEELNSVYGGSMTPEEWVAAEMDAKEMQGWNVERPGGFTARVSDMEFYFEYHNTRAQVFDGDYFWLSFIHHNDGDRRYYLTPGETEASHEMFGMLVNEMINRGFHFLNRATPTHEALNFYEKQIRAGEDIEDTIDRLLMTEEGS